VNYQFSSVHKHPNLEITGNEAFCNLNRCQKHGEVVLIEPALSQEKKSQISFFIKEVGKFGAIEKNFYLPIIGNSNIEGLGLCDKKLMEKNEYAVDGKMSQGFYILNNWGQIYKHDENEYLEDGFIFWKCGHRVTLEFFY